MGWEGAVEGYVDEIQMLPRLLVTLFYMARVYDCATFVPTLWFKLNIFVKNILFFFNFIKNVYWIDLLQKMTQHLFSVDKIN